MSSRVRKGQSERPRVSLQTIRKRMQTEARENSTSKLDRDHVIYHFRSLLSREWVRVTHLAPLAFRKCGAGSCHQFFDARRLFPVIGETDECFVFP